jgi:glycosyltransferase involved in cell wall biosynthesis
MKIIAIIPAYNEATAIGEVIDKTRPFVDEVIVINDGSPDRTAEVAQAHGARVYTHCINRGLGAAIGTGFAAALKHGADVAVTLDADGQHDPAEIPLFVDAINHGADFVIGSRMLTRLKGMPFHRKLATFIGNFVTFVLFGARVTDSQSGYRAFTRHALETIEIKTNRMEVSSELIHEAHAKGLHIAEVPIKAIYTDYSLSKGQNFFVGIKTLLKLVMRRIAR